MSGRYFRVAAAATKIDTRRRRAVSGGERISVKRDHRRRARRPAAHPQ